MTASGGEPSGSQPGEPDPAPPLETGHGYEFPPLDSGHAVDYPAGYPPMPPPLYPPVFPPPGQPFPFGGRPADPYDPYRQVKPAGTNTKAIAALITACAGPLFCGLPSVVGLVLGMVAMRETKRTGQDGYGIAVAGVVIGGLITAAIALLVVYLILVTIFVDPSTLG